MAKVTPEVLEKTLKKYNAAIQQEFDAVETSIEDHAQDTDIHMTAEEKAKLQSVTSIVFFTPDTHYDKDVILLHKGNTDTNYSIYICTTEHTSGAAFEETNWEIVSEKQNLIQTSAAQPSETNVLWVDIADANNPLLKFHDGTAWVELSGTGGGFSQYNDYSALPTIANGTDADTLVDGMVAFSANDYADTTTQKTYKKGFYTYSATNDTWDVVYEFDFNEAVKQLKSYIVEANLRTYTGDELEYGEFKIPNDVTCSTGDIISLSKTVGTLEVDANSYLVLKANRTYEVTMTAVSDSKLTLCMYDGSGIKLKEGLFFTGDGGTTNASYTWVVPSMDEDTRVCFKVEDGNSATLYADNNNVVVREINRIIIIDPAKQLDDSTGLEDDPVGKRIVYDGLTVPKHYLLEDGSVYNIADYPYLAQHYLDEYGAVAIYGGDGVTTFAVPDNCVSPGWWQPDITSNDDTLYSWRYTRDGEHQPYYIFNSKYNSVIGNNSYNYWCDADSGYVGVNLKTRTKISKYKLVGSANKLTQNAGAWTFEGSNDRVTWDILDTQVDVTWSSFAEEKEFDLGRVYNYQYYKLNVTATAGFNTWCLGEMIFYKHPDGLPLVKYEPTYFMDTGTTVIGDTITPNANNTDVNFRLDITHVDGTVDTTENLRGRDGVTVPLNGFYAIYVENGSMVLECEDGATLPPLAIETIDGARCLTYDTEGTFQGTLIS